MPLPIMLIISVLQTVAVSRLNILSGSADIVLLSIISWGVTEEDDSVFIWALAGGFFISLMTAMPTLAVFIAYLIIAGITWFIHKRLWQSPILAALLSTILGTSAKFVVDVIGLQFMGIGFRIITSIREIFAPNLILNLFFLFPTYLLMSDLTKWISHKEEYES
ncbi:MAG: hypothetical protein Q7J07_10190 [Pelolinea sp.]|nr:hypothetical protein [Pelolinea sp.]